MMKVFRAQGSLFEGQSVEGWDRTWASESIEEAVRWVGISHLRQVLDRHFPAHGRILEAGCGIGHFVIHYRRRGYDIEGVDFAPDTIERLRRFAPDLPVRVADITALPYDDGHFDCYYSGGVVEHFEEGPFKPLLEARRVLATNGKLIIVVPFFNPLRRLRVRGRTRGVVGSDGRLAAVRDDFVVEPAPPGFGFWEYYFTQQEFEGVLRRAGFAILERYPWDVEWGDVCQAIYRMAGRSAPVAPAPAGGPAVAAAAATNGSPVAAALKRVWKDLFVTEDRSRLWKRGVLRPLSAVSGHMLLFVCQPAAQGAPGRA